MNLSQVKKAYFIGIKGVGMTALVQVLQKRDIEVLGSDTSEKFFTDKVLERLKIKVIENFNRQNVPSDADLVIVSAAYLGQAASNPEVIEAEQKNLPIFSYAQILAMLLKEKYGIAIAGTHGKTTITAMLGLVLEKAGFDPTVIVGAEVLQWQSNARVGQSNYLVAEADEYRNNFLNYFPQVLILTSLEYDHPDFFKDFEEYKAAFQQLAERIPQNGFIVVNGRDQELEKIIKNVQCPIIKYGFEPMKIKLKVPGEHNLLNASAVMAAALKLGIKKEIIEQALAEFQGTRRRFEIKGERKGVLFIDDYAHHPTEIKATLQAAKSAYPAQKIWAVFQPHTFSRTKALLDDFAQAFGQADQVIILDIYGSVREKAGEISARDLVKKVSHYQKKAKYIPTIEQAKKYLEKQLQPGDLVLTMGAGDVWKLSTGE